MRSTLCIFPTAFCIVIAAATDGGAGAESVHIGPDSINLANSEDTLPPNGCPTAF
jgi:hypothetical protein